jgi:hypothetical protein
MAAQPGKIGFYIDCPFSREFYIIMCLDFVPGFLCLECLDFKILKLLKESEFPQAMKEEPPAFKVRVN